MFFFFPFIFSYLGKVFFLLLNIPWHTYFVVNTPNKLKKRFVANLLLDLWVLVNII